jgi:uncharacterized membrane protein
MDTVPPPPPPPPPVAPAAAAPADEKTVAIVSYLTVIGFVIAIVMNGNRKSVFAAYHLRQSLGLLIVGFALGIFFIIPILGWILAPILLLCLAVLWLISLLGAVNHKCKPTPILGVHFQKWFATAFV